MSEEDEIKKEMEAEMDEGLDKMYEMYKSIPEDDEEARQRFMHDARDMISNRMMWGGIYGKCDYCGSRTKMIHGNLFCEKCRLFYSIHDQCMICRKKGDFEMGFTPHGTIIMKGQLCDDCYDKNKDNLVGDWLHDIYLVSRTLEDIKKKFRDITKELIRKELTDK